MTFVYVPLQGKEGESILIETRDTLLTPALVANAFNALYTCIVRVASKDGSALRISGIANGKVELPTLGTDVLLSSNETPVTICLSKQPVGTVKWRDNPQA